MSLKAYYAYRIKKGHNPFLVLFDLKKKAQATAKAEMKRIYWEWMDNPACHAEIREVLKSKEDKQLTPFDCGHFLKEMYKETITSPYKNPWDLDLFLVVHEHQGRVYITPRGGSFIRLEEILAADDRLEEYGYWDNTDMPDGMSRRKWNQRGKVWNAICDEWDRHLTVDILTFDGFAYLDPSWDQDMIDEWRERSAKASSAPTQ
jgi:hypothetical protein